MEKIYKGLDMGGNTIHNIVLSKPILDIRSVEPTDPQEGQFYYNATSKLIRYWNGTNWMMLSTSTMVMRYKGTVNDWSELPTSGMENGDYYLNRTTQVSRIWNEARGDWDEAGSIIITVDSELSDTSLNPLENKIVTAELKKRIELLGNEAASGEPYHFTYYIGEQENTESKLIFRLYTITLDNNKTLKTYDYTMPLAVPTTEESQGKAGLMTGDDKAKLDSLSLEFATNAEIEALFPVEE